MITIKKCTLEDYTFNEKNSSPGEKPSREYPGHAPELALDIKSIIVEEKTAILKTLKTGQTVEFTINQQITISVPDFKLKDYVDINHEAKGEGSGIVSSIEDLDLSMEDDEYQEVTITLESGYAERL